jgi:hypothetical protein
MLGKKKDACGNYTTTAIEKLKYDYNIRGWLKGINKGFVTNTINSNNYFGQTLSYDFGFTQGLTSRAQYNGNISGLQWRSLGDGKQRVYGFEYDAANCLLKADFTRYTSGWNNVAGVDFSMGGNDLTGGTMKYDANGNIDEMWRRTLSCHLRNAPGSPSG